MSNTPLLRIIETTSLMIFTKCKNIKIYFFKKLWAYLFINNHFVNNSQCFQYLNALFCGIHNFCIWLIFLNIIAILDRND